MEDNNNNYKSIFKATSLFGGVQVLSILFSIVKNKIVAIWLGTTGFGIISILNSSATLISSITNLGLQTSAVRDIAAAKECKSDITKTVTITNKLAIATSLIGCIVTILLSPFLSDWFFHNSDYTITFVLLSSVVLFTGLYNQCYAILQGLRKLSYLAISSILGAFLGLIVSIPLYYFLREFGIIWSLIISAFFTFFVEYFFVKKSVALFYNISFRRAIKEGFPTIKLGIFIALSNNIAYLVQFILKAFISNVANVSEVGLFQAGWSLNTMYAGMIFTAMSKDYYPRLCQSSNRNYELQSKMNEQAEIGLLLLSPMVIILITFIEPVLKLLYSSDFISVASMTVLLLFGTLIQVASWSLGYVFLAKSNGKLYFFNEVGTKLLMLPTYILGYNYGRLEGLGIAFIVNQVIYILWVILVSYKYYSIVFSKTFIKLLSLILSIIIVFLFLRKFVLNLLIINLLFSLLFFAFSLWRLNKRVELLSLFKR